ncbi:MAG: FtsK/SpoIIIE domain-containing protein [Candidatus Krumholzibacteriota bacterium]|nr:FtsK/SpoIIIE domain-containing protein [Candidatus Krumholzibacteriota bacterium]
MKRKKRKANNKSFLRKYGLLLAGIFILLLYGFEYIRTPWTETVMEIGRYPLHSLRFLVGKGGLLVAWAMILAYLTKNVSGSLVPGRGKRAGIMTSLIISIFFMQIIGRIRDAGKPWGGLIGEAVLKSSMGEYGIIGGLLFISLLVIAIIQFGFRLSIINHKNIKNLFISAGNMISKGARNIMNFLKNHHSEIIRLAHRMYYATLDFLLEDEKEESLSGASLYPQATKPINGITYNMASNSSSLDHSENEKDTESQVISSNKTESRYPDMHRNLPDILLKNPLPLEILPDVPNEIHKAREKLHDEMDFIEETIIRMAYQMEGVRLGIMDNNKIIGMTSMTIKFTRNGREGPVITNLSRIVNDLQIKIGRNPISIYFKDNVVFEIPLKPEECKTVYLKELLYDLKDLSDDSIKAAIGKDSYGKPTLLDFGKDPHYLIGGSTGSGKTICLKSIALGLACRYSPENLWLVCSDHKGDLRRLEALPHMKIPIAKDDNEFIDFINYLEDMTEFRKKIIGTEEFDRLPKVVAIIDEVHGFEDRDRLAGLLAVCRSLKISIILATQHPKSTVLPTKLTANCPGRIAFKTATKSASRIIIEESDAYKLLGQGDGLVKHSRGRERFKGAFVSDMDLEAVDEYVSVINEMEVYDA